MNEELARWLSRLAARRAVAIAVRGAVVFAIVLTGATRAHSQAAGEAGIINRRDEARRAYLSSPSGVYYQYCAHCHGEDGSGDGRLWVSDLSPKPSDLTATQLDQEALVTFITDGAGASGRSQLCPPWGNTISPQNIERLSMHILSLDGERAAAAEPQAPLQPPDESVPWFWILVLTVEVFAIGVLSMRRTSRKVA